MPDRVCACGTKLSKYNPDAHCAACAPRPGEHVVPHRPHRPPPRTSQPPLPGPNSDQSKQPERRPEAVPDPPIPPPATPRGKRRKARVLDEEAHPEHATVKCRKGDGNPALVRTVGLRSPRYANLCLEHWQGERTRNGTGSSPRQASPEPGAQIGPRHAPDVPPPPPDGDTRRALTTRLAELGEELDGLTAARESLNARAQTALDEWADVLYRLGKLDEQSPAR